MLKAYQITYNEIVVYYCAESRGRARYIAAMAIHEAGYCTVSEALKKIKCRRKQASHFDIDAEKKGREGYIGTFEIKRNE
jgi:hypothetical protein